jgi:hypothetical protein
MDDREHMLALLRRLAAECAASTDSRPWKALVGLSNGTVVELGRVELSDVPTIVLEDRRRRGVIYTTLRDVVHLELVKGGAPRLEGALAREREEAEPSWADERPGLSPR